MILLVIFIGLLPGIAWLLFYLREDLHPEPKRLILATFTAGASFSLIALFLQLCANGSRSPGIPMLSPLLSLSCGDGILPALGVTPFSPISLIVFALIEEITKFAAAYAIIHKNPEFDEPVDAMIYAVAAALGFATIENIGALYGLPSNGILLGSIFETLSLRFVGATLLHALTSALVGYFWAISIRNFNATRFLIWGLLLATILHAVFNYLILLSSGIAYPILLLLIVGFFVLNDFEKLKSKVL